MNSPPDANKMDVSRQALLARTASTPNVNAVLPAVRALLSVDESCTFLGVGRTTLYGLIARRELTAVKIGRRTKLRHTDLLAFIDALPPAGKRATGME